MGILDEISSATGDKNSNHELAKQCLLTPALLHTIAEGLRTGMPKARVDCAEILAEVCERRPDLLADFVTDFVDASKSPSKAVAKLGFEGMLHLIPSRPAEIYAERDYLLEAAKGPVGLQAAAVLAALCGHNANYRGKLLAAAVRLLANVPDKDLPKWVTTLGPAVEGSPDGLKRLTLALEPRRAALPEAVSKKIDKQLVKLEKSVAKK